MNESLNWVWVTQDTLEGRMDLNRSQTMGLCGVTGRASDEEGRVCGWDWEKSCRKIVLGKEP